MNKIILLLKKNILVSILLLFALNSYSQNQWNGSNAVGNFSYCDNWYSSSCPGGWNGTTDLLFQYRNNASQLSLYFNLGGWRDVQNFIFNSTFGQSTPLTGDGNGFNIYGKLENSSYYKQSIGVPTSFKGGTVEINAVNADMDMNSVIYNSSNKTINIYGPNSKLLTFNNYIEGTTASMNINQYSKVAIAYDMTGRTPAAFGGGVNINTGELWINSGGKLNGGTISLGSSSVVSKLYINATDGTQVANNIVIRTFAGSTQVVGSFSTSGTNEYTGTVTLNQPVIFETASGGTTKFTGIIGGAAGNNVTINNLTGSGTATIVYNSATTNTYSGSTTINSGANLKISTDQTLGAITLSSGGTLTVDAGKTLTITGTYTGGGTIINNGTIKLSGAASQSFPGNSTTISAMSNLTITNSSTTGVTIDKAFSISGTFSIPSGLATMSQSITAANLSLGGLGTANGTWGFTGSGATFINTTYFASTGIVTVTNDTRATPTLTTAPTATAITYGQTLASSTLSGGVASVGGVFAFTTPSTVPSAGTASQGVTFTPTNTGNYKTFTTTASVTVNKATPTATLSVSNSPATYTGSGQAATVGISTSSVVGAVSTISTGGAATQTAAGTYGVTASFVPTDSANYNTLTGLSAGNFVINKATSTVSVTGITSFTYNVTAQGPSTATVTGSTGAVTYSYTGVSLSYGPSVTSPTNVGSYTVTATVAADSNYNGANSSATSFTIGASTYIPDVNFEQALIGLSFDSGPIDHYVLTSTISGITTLDISNKSISNLTGIEAFSSLQSLICSNNSISSLNVNGLTNLNYLLCDNNSLTSLNVSGLVHLQTLGMMVNSVTSLDVSNNPNLTYLDCSSNAITSLNVSGLTLLNQFYCSNNLLSNLSVRGLIGLVNFECTTNPSLTCILVDDVSAANTASITIDPSQSPNTFWAKDSGAVYSYCNCSLTTTWNGSTWDHGAPTAGTYAAIISGNYNVAANISACSLTVNNNAVVTIPSGFNVTLNSPLTVETGSSFSLSNNANLIQSTNVANSGNIVVNRDSNPLYRLDYTLWSSPVASQNLLTFSPLTITTRFYNYNAGTNLYNAIASPSTTAFGTGTGYLIRMPNTAPDFPTTSTFSGIFTGVPNTGNISLSGLSSNAYYAVGNPYPSTLNADSFLSGNATDGTLYFWRKTNAALGTAYATYTLGGSTGTSAGNGGIIPNGTIQVGQGFIVKTGISATALNFTNAMRVSSSSTQFFKTKNVVEKDRIWLNLTNTTGVFSQMLVGYMTNATQGVDAGIDGMYINDSPIALTSIIGNAEFSIQCRALPFDPADTVPLSFKTDVAGDYTIAIDHFDGLFSGAQDIVLLDTTNGMETDLKAGAYTFTAPAGATSSRFSLKYQKTLGVKTSIFDENSIIVYKSKGVIYINSGTTTMDNVKIFDIQGRLIAEQKKVKATSTMLKDLGVNHQVLIVQITSEDNKVVSKKMVN